MTAAPRQLKYLRLARFELESGEVLHDAVQAYHLDGPLGARRDNVILVFHALTGNADAVGDWWPQVAGPGRPLDTTRYAVLSPNLLGSCYGSTGPSRDPSRPFPKVTTRDMARFVGELVDALGIRTVTLAVGGSLGGMVALEWAATFPARSKAVLALAAPAAHTPFAIGWSHIQRQAIAAGGPQGLALARMVGTMTYRTPTEFEARFGREVDGQGNFAVQSYLSHQAEKLLARFDARTYRTLLDAMDAHDVGRGRGGVGAALGAFRGYLAGVGIPGDLLYGYEDVRAWTEAAGAELRTLRSPFGHDAFLIEEEKVGKLLREALEFVECSQERPVADVVFAESNAVTL